MRAKRLLRLKHDQVPLGFLSASIVEEESGRESHWTLRVESPASYEEFLVHLKGGSGMSLSMTTRDGVQLRGEAYVASISEGVDTATIVVLSGAGPLRRV